MIYTTLCMYNQHWPSPRTKTISSRVQKRRSVKHSYSIDKQPPRKSNSHLCTICINGQICGHCLWCIYAQIVDYIINAHTQSHRYLQCNFSCTQHWRKLVARMTTLNFTALQWHHSINRQGQRLINDLCSRRWNLECVYLQSGSKNKTDKIHAHELHCTQIKAPCTYFVLRKTAEPCISRTTKNNTITTVT